MHMKKKVIGNNIKDMGRNGRDSKYFQAWISIHLEKGNRELRLYCLEVFKWYLTMKWLEITKSCPCRKGEDCVNGLKCTEKNCFLLKNVKTETGGLYLYR